MPNEPEMRWFKNPHDGQQFRIVALPTPSAPGRFVLEYRYLPFRGETAVPAHLHPTATESFEILAGRARYRLNGIEGLLGPGDRIVMPPGLPHVHPWSASDEPLHVRQTGVTDPADPAGILASIQAQITIYGLAREGRVNRAGLPNLLQLAVLVRAAMPATYLAGIPIGVQRGAFRMLAALATPFGYRTGYARYGTVTPDGVVLPPDSAGSAR